MPKGKRKGKYEGRNQEYFDKSSDDDSFDNLSVVSNTSENRSTEDGEEVDELAQEQLEEKLCDFIDGLTQKSSQGRTNCLQSLNKAFIKKLMPMFVKERLFTLCDSVEKSLKRGGSAERIAAAELATLLCVQLGAEDSCEDICQSLKPVLLATAADNSVAASVRATYCIALGNIAFLSGGELGDVLLLMQQLESIFSASYLKGDGTVPNITPEVATLHAAAINAWTLLSTLMDPANIAMMVNNPNTKNFPSLDQLAEFLKSAHLDVRMAGGEALALVFELGRLDNEAFAEDFAMEVTETLKQLATDSHKYRSKKDRKTQRATFRDILQFIENDSVPDLHVKLRLEELLLDTWTRRKQYDSICNILGPGINVHLSRNELLRDMFELDDMILKQEDVPRATAQMERYRRRKLNAANFKARTLSRAKNRDKRSDF